MRWSALFSLALLPALLACGRSPEEPDAGGRVVFEPSTFAELPGWREDDLSRALVAFIRSCAAIERKPADGFLYGLAHAGTVADWQEACGRARRVDAGSARDFFEAEFRPLEVSSEGERAGLITGYFEPLLHASRAPSTRYRWPLYARPDDLIVADLGSFDPTLGDRTIKGRIIDGRFLPYHDRADIDAGALEGRDLELFWVDDGVERFFLEIQGSGQLQLDTGERRRVGYAEQNGRPYRAIGRDLIEMGELEPQDVSLQSISAWLRDHPERAMALMHRNPSVVFFTDRGPVDPSVGPVGALGIPLTPGRSLAVDRAHIPLGAPVYLTTSVPTQAGEVAFDRLMIAQDTGGAIKGAVRGDIFFGAGEDAEYAAGHTKARGSYYLLVPRSAGLAS